MADNPKQGEFPLAEARELVKDLAQPNPWIYWTDFLVSVSIGWTAFVLTLAAPVSVAVRVALFAVSAAALYRSVFFIHELAHVRRGGLKVFRVVWNFLVGFPLMLPSFVYAGVHNEHHTRTVYGTADDGEYWPFVWDRPYKIIGFPVLSLVLPLYFAARFVVLTPVLPLSKKLRELVWVRFSSLGVIMKYQRPLPATRREARAWLVQEWIACVYGVTAVVLVIAGVLPVAVLGLWYAVTAVCFLLNSLRTLAAHAYRNPGTQVMTQAEQLRDSINVPGLLFFASLWAPVGLRYHGTHHLYPIMPYHSLGEAHRRLTRKLKDNSVYMESVRSSLWDALRRLWKETRANARA